MSSENHIEPQLPAPKSRWVSSLIFGAVIFACGAAAGTAIGIHWESQDDYRALPKEGSYADRMTAHLTEELALTPEQAESIQSIFERHMQQFREIHATISPALKTQMDALRDEVGLCLDEDQRVRWEEKVERYRERYRSFY